jgi:hypothetical protein
MSAVMALVLQVKGCVLLPDMSDMSSGSAVARQTERKLQS